MNFYRVRCDSRGLAGYILHGKLVRNFQQNWNDIEESRKRAMADSVDDALKEEVEKYLKRWRPFYEDFLRDILTDIMRFRDRGDNFDCIYRIYSRADKQRGGDKLKSVGRIVAKLRTRRSKNPRYQLKKINDIVGLTVVVYYESDLKKITESLSLFKSDVFKIVKSEDKKEKGYFAKHFDLMSLDPTHNEILAEMQVKSLLNDGWSTKTHDFTYNPIVRVDPAILKMVESLGNQIAEVESLSDNLRILTTKHLEADELRRNMAVTTLTTHMFRFTRTQKKKPDAQLVRLVGKLTKAQKVIASCDSSHSTLSRLISTWKKLVKMLGYSRETCRFIVLLASFRKDRDFDQMALGAVDEWIGASSNKDERTSAVSFLGLANYILGHIDEAIDAGRDDVKLSKRASASIAIAKMNLAYYLAEKYYISPSGRNNKALFSEIKRLLTEVSKIRVDKKNIQLAASLKDSQGAIQIMTAASIPEIYKGLNFCDEARILVKGTEGEKVFNAYYNLHERRANNRVMAMQSEAPARG